MADRDRILVLEKAMAAAEARRKAGRAELEAALAAAKAGRKAEKAEAEEDQEAVEAKIQRLEAALAAEKAGRKAAEAGRKAHEEALASVKARRKAVEAALAAEKAAIEQAGLITLSKFVCERRLVICNLTDSSAHLPTGYRIARIETVDSVPEMNLPNDFWDALIHFNQTDRSYSSEAHVTYFNTILVRAITQGLRLTNVRIVPQLHNFDSKPHLTLLYGKNYVAGLSWEDKKGTGGPAIWQSDTQCAGQVFEQLAVNHVCLGCPVYGIQSTYNSVRLVSSHNFANVQISGEQVTPPPSPAVSASVNPDSEGYRAVDTMLTLIPKIKNTEAEKAKGKITRVQDFVLEEERTFFASKLYEFGNDEQENKETIKLIATAIMLAKQSVDAPARNMAAVPLSGPARIFDCSRGLIYNSPVYLQNGIQFDLRPTSQHKIFHAFKQIGVGGTSVCCLATTQNSAACALKVFNATGKEVQKLAKKEADNWEKIYQRNDWKFISAYVIDDRHFLVLPYFEVPSNQSQRDNLVRGERNSLLWEALTRIANAGYAHDDIKWQHVGTIRTQKKKRDRNENCAWEEKAFILDLGDEYLRTLQPNERDSWVSERFNFLKERTAGATQ